MRDRAILHSDANCFYASVETVLNPEFRGKAIAVCGSPEERHGIVLAKSEKAKRAGVKTGMANWQAKQCCRDLIIVPPQYDYYLKFSKLLHGIYRRYTDQVEPFGMDECWLDVTYSPGDPMEIAEEIRQAVKDELGLTVSIGVSFNKVFAKLGSDYKKPDAITQISKEHFKEIVWPLPCSDLLYCGNATTAKLGSMGVRTIGGIASLPVEVMQRKFGKNGVALWKYANGLDDSRVAHQDYTAPAKSVGHGITCVADLENMDEARKVIFALSLDIGYNEKDAFYAALHAAWACDDEREIENAIHCRQCALTELEKILADPNTPEDMHVVKTDLLRRTGQFDALISNYTGKQFSKELLNQIVAFQIEKARQNDTQCYRIQDVPGTEDA